MKKTILLLLLMLSNILVNAQSFEGTVSYKIDFEFDSLALSKMGGTMEMMEEQMKANGEYFDTIKISIKDGNYIKEDNAKLTKRIIYKSEVNKIYIFQKDFDHVIITDATNYSAINLSHDEPEIIVSDSVRIINDIECTAVVMKWKGIGEEYYFFNPEILSLDASLFSKHNYEYLNTLLNISNAYPIEIIKTLNQFVTIKMTLIDYKKEKIDGAAFDLPKLKKANKEYANMMKKMTGSDVMKIVE